MLATLSDSCVIAMLAVLPDGATLTRAECDVNDTQSAAGGTNTTHPITFQVRRSNWTGTSLGGAQDGNNLGAQTIGVNTSEDTTGRVYFFSLEFDNLSGASCPAGKLIAGALRLTYTPANPNVTV